MDDFISRTAALEALIGWETDPTDEEIENAINSIPTVDAALVVRGQWIKVHGYATPGGDPVWECSRCGKGIHTYGIEHGSYGASIADGQWVACPNCGAVMTDTE